MIMAFTRIPDDPFDKHFKPGTALAWLRAAGFLDAHDRAAEPLWVFGYGSLMWNPGFAHDLALPALIRGYHRRYCVRSYRYRGTPEYPGLVLGLDRGGACWGMGFRIPVEQVADCAEYLWYREMISAIYEPRFVPLVVKGQRIKAVTFCVQREHRQYFPGHDLDEVAEIIVNAVGPRGPNIDYFTQTHRHLRELKMRDPKMDALAAIIEEKQS
jgi:Uncharacterized protein involved in cation transport